MTDPFGDLDRSVTGRVAAELAVAGADARRTYSMLSSAFTEAAAKGRTALPIPQLAQVRRIVAAAQHAGLPSRDVRELLARAGTVAERVDRLVDEAGNGVSDGGRLAMFRAAQAVMDLGLLLDQAAARLQPGGVTAGRAVKRRSGHQVEQPRYVVAAADLVPPVGAQQPIEVTAPGLILGLAVGLLPRAHRPRYAEEFRGEVRDLPPRQQVGYALRQCLQALALRRGLRRTSRGRGPVDAEDTGRRTPPR